MTMQAISPQLTLVFVLVTCYAIALETKEGPAEVFQLDFEARGGRDVFRVMTILASLLAVLACEGKPGLRAVVEVVAVQTAEPVSLSVMLHMTPRAVRLARRFLVCSRVIASS